MKRIKKTTGVLFGALLASICFINIVLLHEWEATEGTKEELTQVSTNEIPYSLLFNCTSLASCPDSRKEAQASTLRTSQFILTRMLRVFSLICKKHNISFFLYRGTLLGAARHRGHNPLDNDVDLAILGKDYQRFENVMQLELPEDMFLQTTRTDPYFKPPPITNMLAKIRDRSSCYTELKCQINCLQNGLQIDINILASGKNSKEGHFLDFYSSSGYLWRYLMGPLEYRYSDIFPLDELEFDGYMFPVPCKWKEYLRKTYGSTYMTMPAPGFRYPLQSGSKVDNFQACAWDRHGKMSRKRLVD